MYKMTAEEKQLDDKFQKALKDYIAKGIKEDPPCPKCGGKMKAWDAWLVTGSNCTKCNWGMNEGTGCLI